MMDRLAKIRERIRRLRRMTVENGCSEQEALRAAALALRLLGKYGLHEDDLAYELSPMATYARRRQVIDSLWSTVALVTNCEGFLTRGDRLRYTYFGHPADIAVACYLHELLCGAFRRECRDFKDHPEYTRRRKRKTRNAAMKAFQQAMVRRLRHRLVKLWWLHAKQSSEGGQIYREIQCAPRPDVLRADAARPTPKKMAPVRLPTGGSKALGSTDRTPPAESVSIHSAHAALTESRRRG